MSALHAKLKLVGQTYLFCEKVSLIKNIETVLDLSKLNIADLEVIGHHIQHGGIESNVSADEFMDRAAKLREEVKEGKVDEVVKLQDVTEVRVLDAEVELEDGTVTTVKEVGVKKEDPRKTYVQEKVIDVPAAVALINVKNIPDCDREVLEYALATETATKGRKSVLTEIKNLLEELDKEDSKDGE